MTLTGIRSILARSILVLWLAAAGFALIVPGGFERLPVLGTNDSPQAESDDLPARDRLETAEDADAPAAMAGTPEFNSDDYVPSRLGVNEYRPSKIDPPTYLPSELTPAPQPTTTP
jgi:hypothetical protein